MSPWREIQLTPNGFRCLILKVCKGNRIRQITKLYFNETQTTYSVYALHKNSTKSFYPKTIPSRDDFGHVIFEGASSSKHWRNKVHRFIYSFKSWAVDEFTLLSRDNFLIMRWSWDQILSIFSNFFKSNMISNSKDSRTFNILMSKNSIFDGRFWSRTVWQTVYGEFTERHF